MYAKNTAIFEAEIEINENETETREIIVKPDQVDWESDVFDPDRQMGAEYYHIGTTTVVVEDTEYTITWTIYEYPKGILNDQKIDAGGLRVIKDIQWRLH